MKWVHLVQWEHLDSKGSVETLAAQGVLLQALLVKEVLQASQGDQDHLVLWVPKEELLWVTFPTQVLLEIRDFLALMAQEENPGPQDPRGVWIF